MPTTLKRDNLLSFTGLQTPPGAILQKTEGYPFLTLWAFKILRRTVCVKARGIITGRRPKPHGRHLHAYGDFVENFVERSAYIQKRMCFMLFWRPRVSDRNPAPRVSQ